MNENLNWINALRVLATFGVIFLHTTADILYQYGSIAEIDWWIGNIYDSSVRFCVPVFLMISGALILSKTYENLKEYLIKRVLRVLLPFLFWSAIYIAIDIFGKLFKGEQMTFSEILSLTFLKLKNGASFHLWYIYLIIGLYLFFPILNKWLLNSNKTEITYFLAIWSIIVLEVV
jgi:surface polysaccharide O-acyltransferase-like enzyme